MFDSFDSDFYVGIIIFIIDKINCVNCLIMIYLYYCIMGYIKEFIHLSFNV